MNDYEILCNEYSRQLKSLVSQGLLQLQLEGYDLNDEEESRLRGYDGFIQDSTWRSLPNLDMIHYVEERLAYLRSMARDARNVSDADRMDTEDE